VPGFAPCDEDTLLDIVGDSVNLFWPAGSVVFEHGSPSDGLFIVLAGCVRVVGPDETEIARLGPGHHFGEVSLLLGVEHRNAVIVDKDSELMVLPRESVDALFAANPELAARIRATAAERSSDVTA
jgi:CRP-like cAMP-binding protein